MSPPIVPRELKRALELIEGDPSRAWTVVELAAASRLAPRTLQKHFRRFLGRTPLDFLRERRFEMARKELLVAEPEVSVSEIALRCGLSHLGRFASEYSKRYGESPSETLRRSRQRITGVQWPATPVRWANNRPTVAVLPFKLIGTDARGTGGLAEEIVSQLLRAGWITVVASDRAKYHLCGKIRDLGGGLLRTTALLLDIATGRYVWADHCDSDISSLHERIAARIAGAVEQSVRTVEMDRSYGKDPSLLDAWELNMRALRLVLSFDPEAEGTAIELLDRAMELAPQDPLPVALAAWCHGLRAGHHFTERPEAERERARSLISRAEKLGHHDPLTDTLLAAGQTLSGDLATAAVRVERALMSDGGSSWAWGRSGWIEAYSGRTESAIERLQIARGLATGDPLSFLWAIGIGAAHFEAARYEEAIRWFTQALAEHPTAVWNHRFMIPAYVLAGRTTEAKQSFAEFTRGFPELTITQVRAGLPYSANFLDRVAEGLASIGMRIS